MTKKQELSHFIHSTPEGTIFTSSFLAQIGVSAKLAWWYTRSGLLKRIAPKLYIKKSDVISWPAVVSTLQSQMDLSIHVGGISALNILRLIGKNNLSDDSDFDFFTKKIFLFANAKITLPSWLSQYENYFEIVNCSLFKSKGVSAGLVKYKVGKVEISISCPERAVMEILHISPKVHTLYSVAEWMEMLKDMKPDITQLLLENCNSIKVKRFFLYFAERFWHSMASELDLKKINLGSGKRVIGRGGIYRYHPKYMLSLPEKIEDL
jgi:hypothetical protein